MLVKNAILHCALIPGVGDATIAHLTAVLDSTTFHELYSWHERDFVTRAGISPHLAKLLVTGLADKKMLEQELFLLEKHHVQWMTVFDQDYPDMLREIYAPPAVLYWRGAALSDLVMPVAVVGSRAANRYGRAVIEHLVPELVGAGCSVVSGGALGADTMAHEVALNAKGKTVAVIGSGLLKPYPASNKRLFERICDSGGSVISPFPLEMQAVPGNFPARNRIISGLSRAVVVVQAAEKSGARITALQALEQGREVCVVPGDIFDPLSAGCHRLIGEGATPVTSATDILRACGCDVSAVVEKPKAEKRVLPVLSNPSLAENEDPIFLLCHSPRTFDELLMESGESFGVLQEKLFNFQLDGVLAQDFLGRWTRV